MKAACKVFANKVDEKGWLLACWYSLAFLFDIPYRRLWLHPIRQSFSQAGEDRILDRLLGGKASGFYVDVGAYDPHALSNTKRFSLRGWRGINVEPNRICHEKFLRDRVRDINLNVGIGKERQPLTFFVMNAAPLSTFSEEQAHQSESLGYRILKRETVEVITLEDLFRQFVKDQPVDFLTIDAEGLDFSVLECGDWNRWRPSAICVEAGDYADRKAIAAKQKRLLEYMRSIRYRHHATTLLYGTPLNMIFAAEEFKPAQPEFGG